ncbi:FMN-dependent NADH-azoreductase [Neptuniibacter sp. QD57_21]|uniref:FMN-dependent NADH-azoreductase n=1 Tax=Neptuniibacter sp. QD57_21 TaxID=3398213 RepID=UPI0039F5F318
MPTILHIDASARGWQPNGEKHQSISRYIAHLAVTTFKKMIPDCDVIYRDLAKKPPEFINEQWIAACFSESPTAEQNKALAQSDQYIAEIEQADIIVLSSPMYNYGMPAVLKAWFDQVIRINKTFSFDLARGDYPLEPILSGKQLILCTSWGEFDFAKGKERAHLNHLSPHIEQLSPYLGVDKFYEISSEYQEFSDQRHKASLEAAQLKAVELAHSIAETYATAVA